jgi:hypothetical protein
MRRQTLTILLGTLGLGLCGLGLVLWKSPSISPDRTSQEIGTRLPADDSTRGDQATLTATAPLAPSSARVQTGAGSNSRATASSSSKPAQTGLRSQQARTASLGDLNWAEQSEAWNPRGIVLAPADRDALRVLIFQGRQTVESLANYESVLKNEALERAIQDGSVRATVGPVTIKPDAEGVIGIAHCEGDKTWNLKISKDEFPHIWATHESVLDATKQLETNILEFFESLAKSKPSK